MAIVKKLAKIGNSSALIIDRAVLDLMNIKSDTPVEISIGPDSASLVIRAVVDKEENRKSFKAALKQGNKRYGGTMKKLAAK